ncbi:MAG: hypothetical protein KJ675_16880 [Gammaproteobacteria bacterium]|nr:hypothetical protein [Gammaproteobacteria bacterium]
MSLLIFLIVFVPITLLIALCAAGRGDRSYLFYSTLGAWLFLGALVVVVNAWQPFSEMQDHGGSDDHDYFFLAGHSFIGSWGELFDLQMFIDIMEQPGYPWLLSLLSFMLGHELLVYKFMNLFFLILLAIIWYRIGLTLESSQFGRRMMLLILFLTPLWYYVFFLLKDMSIALLQSLFVLAVVQIWSVPRARSIFSASYSSFGLLLFRTPLILQNATVLIGALTSKVFARGVRGGILAPLLVGLSLLAIAVPVVMNPQVMMLFGINAEHRVIGSSAMLESSALIGERSEMNRALFPLLYLFSETTGLNPQSWRQFGSSWLRGVLALPWIFLLIPFFLLGLRWLLLPPRGAHHAKGLLAHLRQSRMFATPWSVVLLFVATSVAISWTVGDSTRWRIPDMPMVAAIAMAGWTYCGRTLRQQVLLVWIGGATMLFVLYFLLRG